ncbi:hypothetical protein [Mucilaginibacter polytrichastri]|uniref:HTH tetR-type domain-containing protein n=1 Tax=Mucilaginibacter polytrichastri TaxID=1302689 RepID=A0A1Q5ZWB3_9SPHI|nr:hypothetical protein [Mucilaginibacter polytrichastri]OKS86030.1 hypothetical protein RG47T_1477 [Mucilaginibacter polytrichastri]SFS59527.1 hypothetical protein SAMN04487890_102107 [Mucilaginibacter polytrichastri]
MGNKEKIIQVATQFINKYGAEHISLKQVAVSSELTLDKVKGLFGDIEYLIVCCVQQASDHMSRSVVSACSGKDGDILFLWQSLVQFNCIHTQEGGLIARFLKSPSLFPHVDIKAVLLQAVDERLASQREDLFSCNDYIRLTGLAYLIQMAFGLAAKLNYKNDGTKLSVINCYFFEHVQSHLYKLIRLPIR